MAKEKDDSAAIDPKALVDALKSLPQDELKALLSSAGAVPTTMGMTPEHLQVLMGSMTAVSSNAMRESYRQSRRENPNYPERSIFNPSGVFDDEGNALPPKVKFRRPSFHNNVRLGGELETAEEIELFNRFTETKTARDGKWKFEVLDAGTSKERCMLTTPSHSPDDRMENSIPLPLILMELFGGESAVNAVTLQQQISAMQAEINALKKQPAEAVA